MVCPLSVPGIHSSKCDTCCQETRPSGKTAMLGACIWLPAGRTPARECSVAASRDVLCTPLSDAVLGKRDWSGKQQVRGVVVSTGDRLQQNK